MGCSSISSPISERLSMKLAQLHDGLAWPNGETDFGQSIAFVIDLVDLYKTRLRSIYEEYKTAEEMFDAVTKTYGIASNTHIQLLIEKYNGIVIKEGESVVDHVNELLVIAKELAALGNTIPDKMQVSTILFSLPDSWDLIVISINVSGPRFDSENFAYRS
ncbi:hypothetical protein RJ639_038660 [Escallonia herrerae]|uniref:Retrovirus-related Pol polyprotein from transposon TNT 1-94 n=1 Tax=Escallonia herrerae TaxID=1293975 RepID=A0AA88WKK8_9ASTE|nr:hypothetical protein RJ639_038660 [Escallonia herrerae]